VKVTKEVLLIGVFCWMQNGNSNYISCEYASAIWTYLAWHPSMVLYAVKLGHR